MKTWTRRVGGCSGCLVAGAAALLVVGALLIGRGDAQAARLREQAERDADRLLADAGHGWAHLHIDDATAYLQGEAPDERSRLEAIAHALVTLEPMMGMPGIFARLEDLTTTAGRGPVSSPHTSTPDPAEPVAQAPSAPTERADVAGPSHEAVSSAVPAGVAPVDPDCARRVADHLRRHPVRFLPASERLTRDDLDTLAEIARRLSGCGDVDIRVEGHTDRSGEAWLNRALSQRRAEAVTAALVREGVPARRLQAVGLGGERPLPGAGAGRDARSRRIEIHVMPARAMAAQGAASSNVER